MRKVVDFDLRVADLKQYYGNNYTYAYKEIENFLLKHGFEHDQGSGYISENDMDKDTIANIIIDLHHKFPWFIKCVDDFRYASIGKQYDGIDIILNDSGNDNVLMNEILNNDLNEEDNEYTI